MNAMTVEEYKTYLTRDNGFPWGIELEPGDNHFTPFYANPEARSVNVPFPKSAGQFAYLASSLPLLSDMDQAEWGGGWTRPPSSSLRQFCGSSAR